MHDERMFVRAALRRLVRRPHASILSVLVLASGISLAGAAMSPLWTATFSSLPLHAPERLVAIWEVSDERGWTDAPASPANLRDWLARTDVFEDLAFHSSGRLRGDDA